MQDYTLPERKLIYRVLHSRLMEFPELMDSQFLNDLQRSLQKQAQADHVDIADHGAWDAWLGNTPVECSTRVAERRTFS